MSHSQTSKCDHCSKEFTYKADEGGWRGKTKGPVWFQVSLQHGNRERLKYADACSVQCAFHLFEGSLAEMRTHFEECEDVTQLQLTILKANLPSPTKP